jgi:hypothetical protein
MYFLKDNDTYSKSNGLIAEEVTNFGRLVLAETLVLLNLLFRLLSASHVAGCDQDEKPVVNQCRRV